jgi:type VI secretion system secreted protein Hcp
MALNAYLKIEGIKGESTATQHKDEIDVMSFSWGIAQSGTVGGGGGGGTGKASAEDFSFVLKIDKSSPLLYKFLATGEHIKEATLTLVRAGKERADYLKYKFEDVIISSFAPATDTAPVEGPSPHMGPAPHLANADFAAGGAAIRARKVEYSVAGADGNWVTFAFDFAENRVE